MMVWGDAISYLPIVRAHQKPHLFVQVVKHVTEGETNASPWLVDLQTTASTQDASSPGRAQRLFGSGRFDPGDFRSFTIQGMISVNISICSPVMYRRKASSSPKECRSYLMNSTRVVWLNTKIKTKALNRVERVKGVIWWRLQSIVTFVLEKKHPPQHSQNFQFPILRANTKICLSNAIVLKFGENHHNDKRNLSCKFHQYPSWGRLLKFCRREGHHQGWKRPSPTRIDFDEIYRKGFVAQADFSIPS